MQLSPVSTRRATSESGRKSALKAVHRVLHETVGIHLNGFLSLLAFPRHWAMRLILHLLSVEPVPLELSRRAIPTASLAAHRTAHAVGRQLALKLMTRVPAAAVRTVERSGHGPTTQPGHCQCVGHEQSCQARLDRPACDRSASSPTRRCLRVARFCACHSANHSSPGLHVTLISIGTRNRLRALVHCFLQMSEHSSIIPQRVSGGSRLDRKRDRKGMQVLSPLNSCCGSDSLMKSPALIRAYPVGSLWT
ncbi:hypothetical protein R75465_05639 [Paraburkholderia aspalathi]|nr:hypothetical protein R75465_05639 [Paraburkholderia aspalathi]